LNATGSALLAATAAGTRLRRVGRRETDLRLAGAAGTLRRDFFAGGADFAAAFTFAADFAGAAFTFAADFAGAAFTFAADFAGALFAFAGTACDFGADFFAASAFFAGLAGFAATFFAGFAGAALLFGAEAFAFTGAFALAFALAPPAEAFFFAVAIGPRVRGTHDGRGAFPPDDERRPVERG
jgi:hypothetical protein